MKDMKGYSFTVGCKVIRAVMWGKSPRLEECEVTRIENGKLYLDDSKKAINYPDRLLIIEHDKLYKIIQDYEKTKE
jgi:hypothetical protein